MDSGNPTVTPLVSQEVGDGRLIGLGGPLSFQLVRPNHVTDSL